MQRYFVLQENITSDSILMDREQWHHIIKVMRGRIGDPLYCIDQGGTVYLCKVANLESKRVSIIEKIKENNELDVEVTLLYGMPKNDKFEWVLQKATELGVSSIVPLMLKRCQRKNIEQIFDKKIERYRKILLEASEQSCRNKIPVLHNVMTMKNIHELDADIKIIAYEEDAKLGEVSNLKSQLSLLKKGMEIMIVVGPEGGFDKDEVAHFEDLGYVRCGLGKRILRSETAPLYLLSVIGYHNELMNG